MARRSAPLAPMTMPIYPDRPESSALAARVQAFVREEALWEAGAHLLVAVSGGPDSVVLLDLLQTAFAPDAGLRLTVGHVHHGLRAEADADAAFVERLAATRNLPYLFTRVDVPARVAETGESVEEAARTLRYAALQTMQRDVEAARIVTGHTADDQAETVLMRVLRGTGLTGLAGIPPRRDEIVRPLLPIWRTEILAYLRERDLPYCTDLTNYSPDFTRSRVRNELLPFLETAYAPRLRVRLVHLAELARQDNVALDAEADAAYARLRRVESGGLVLPATPALSRAIIWRLWRRALAEVRGGLADIGYDHLADIAALTPGASVHLPGARVVHEAGRLVFLAAPDAGEQPLVIVAQPLPVPGRLCLPDVGCCLEAESLSGSAVMRGGDHAVLDAGAVHGPLTVRSWRPGDRYRPLGAPGSRKIQDVFVDAGVPRRLRARVPVVLDTEGIIWLAGFRIADRVKMLPTTAHYLRLTIEWELNPWTLKPLDAA